MHSWRHELAAQTRLAGPVILVNLAMMMMGVVDTQMAGQLSTRALAALGLGHAWVWCPTIFGMGVVFAIEPLVSQARGAGDGEGMARAVQRGLGLVLVISLPIMGLLAVSGPLLGLLADWGPLGLGEGALADQPGLIPAEVVPDAAAYARISALGIPCILTFSALRQTLQALGHLRPIVVVAVLGNGLNVLANLALMYGRWGFPALGLAGCAWATVIVQLIMALTVLAISRPVVGSLLWPLRPRALAARPLLRMLGLGVPIGLAIALEMGAFNTILVLMGRFGEVVMAGHRAAIVVASVTYMVPLGLSTAAAVQVGRAVGAGDQEGVRRAARVALLGTTAVMAVFALCLWTLPGLLARPFTDDPAVLTVAVTLLPLAAGTSPPTSAPWEKCHAFHPVDHALDRLRDAGRSAVADGLEDDRLPGRSSSRVPSLFSTGVRSGNAASAST